MVSKNVQPFGITAEGRQIDKISLTDAQGNTACVINYGAVLQALYIGGRDVVLGYDSVAEYENANSCFGSTMGRCTNRIGGACFTLSGKTTVSAKTGRVSRSTAASRASIKRSGTIS